LSPLEARPFDPAEADIVASWITSEAEAVAWGGPGVRFPVDGAQWAAMMADTARTMWTPTFEGVLAGHFQLARDARRRTVRLGRVAIAPALRGRGLGAQLARLACGIAFGRDPELHRVELQVYAQNIPARAAYARAGFALEGTLREDVPVTSGGVTEIWTTCLMAILRPEWDTTQRVAILRREQEPMRPS